MFTPEMLVFQDGQTRAFAVALRESQQLNAVALLQVLPQERSTVSRIEDVFHVIVSPP
jgi:hypothetical protein